MENFKDKKNDDILEKLVHINRITKVHKGERFLSFCTRLSEICETHLDFIEDAACQEVELLRLLRVMCLQSIVGSGLKPKVLDAYRRMILQVYGHRHLLTLINLEKAGLLGTQGNSSNDSGYILATKFSFIPIEITFC